MRHCISKICQESEKSSILNTYLSNSNNNLNKLNMGCYQENGFYCGYIKRYKVEKYIECIKKLFMYLVTG